MINEDMDDIIRIDRLSEFITENVPIWNEEEIITLEEISCAFNNGESTENIPFGSSAEVICASRDKKWHIGRILYFINHPDEIKGIEIDNMCDGDMIYPIPVILDGNHRFLAAKWLYVKGEMNTVRCRYSGREDLLDYLTGENDICLTD